MEELNEGRGEAGEGEWGRVLRRGDEIRYLATGHFFSLRIALKEVGTYYVSNSQDAEIEKGPVFRV